MQKFFYPLVFSLFYIGSVLSMESSVLDKQIEQQYVEKASSLLNQHAALLTEQGFNKPESSFYRLFKECEESIFSFRATLQESPESFFLNVRDLGTTHPNFFVLVDQHHNLCRTFRDLAFDYFTEKEEHYIAKTIDALNELRNNFERYNNNNISGYTQESPIVIAKKIERIDTWIKTLQESPYSISAVLEQATEYFSKENQMCSQFLGFSIDEVPDQERKKQLPILQTFGESFDSLNSLNNHYLITNLGAITKYIVNN